MARKKPALPAPAQDLSPVTMEDLIENVIRTVKASRTFSVEPVCAITVLEHDAQYCGAVLCLYVAEIEIPKEGRPVIGLTPQFYPAEVATALQERGLLTESSTSRRTGISTTWCYFSDTFV